MRKYLKGKFWKRRLALLLAVSMILTTNVFSIDAVSVYAAEAEDEVTDEAASPMEGVVETTDPAETEDSTDASDAGDVPDSGEAGDSTDVSDAGGVPASGEPADSTDVPGTGDMPDSGEPADSTDVPDTGDMPDSGEAEDSIEVLESTDTTDAPEGENTGTENYSAVGLTEEEFEIVRTDVDTLWKIPDGEDESPYDDRWRGGADTETLLNEISNGGTYQYAFIQPQNPAIEDRTINIPAIIKGVIIDTGWDAESERNEGSEGNEEGKDYSFAVPVDVLNINGTDTCVYFRKGIRIGDEKSNALSIQSPENNTNRVVFDDNVVNAVIDYDSESGTIAFGGGNTINGYTTKSATEFYAAQNYEDEPYEYSELMIREAGGLSFEEITGNDNVSVSIIFNGYPEDLGKLPYFNKEINLGKGIDETSKEEYDIGITVLFREYREQPFGDDWWDTVPTPPLEKGTQIAYFAGTSRNEKRRIGCKVFYYEHGNDDFNLHLDSATGLLEENDVEPEKAAYGVIELNDAEEFNKVKVNTDLIFCENNAYESRWDETDTLAEYLESREYVVIQATKTSHELEDKALELPVNIKGALLVRDWDEDAGTGMEWQLNTLKVKAGTEVYMNDISINTMGQDVNIELEDNTSKVVFGGQCIVNAIVKCESESGTIEFVRDNIVNGYITTAETRFTAPEPSEGEEKAEHASLLIRDAAGLSFESIMGDVDVSLIFNGYPENEDWLPYFNREIDLGKADDENAEDGKRDRGVTIRFWERMDEPFWLDESHADEEEWSWWEAVPAEDLEVGTQAAYFAGTTRKEKESISCRVGYWNHSKTENNLFVSYTGRLEQIDEEGERCSYRVLKLDNAAFNTVKENPGSVYEESYDEQWDETDMLSEYLKSGDLEYVVIQATESSYELDDKTLELPVNIKGVLLLSEWNEEEDAATVWHLNAIKTGGSKEIYICDTRIDPIGQEIETSDDAPEDQGLKIETTATGVNVVIAHSEIMGDLNVSGIEDIKFIDSKVFGATNLGSNRPTVSLEGQFVADNLSGYSALEINGDTTFIVRYHGEVVIENCSFNKTNENPEEGQRLFLVYNGYPEDASLLPVFGDNIVFSDNCGITLRFVQQSDDVFWEGDWWDKTPDELLLIGSRIATVNIDKDKYDGFMDKFGYWSSNAENTENIELVRDETTGALSIQKRSETGKRVVDFVLSAGNTKTYDGAAFTVSESDVTNNCGYTGNVKLAWMTKAGTELEQAPKDAGEYILKMSVPADTQGFEGETQANITITPKTVTVSVNPDENKADGYEIIWTGFVGDETYTTQAEIEMGDEITEGDKKYRMVSTKGGNAGGNYTIVHAAPVKIPVKEVFKPVINSVLFPRNKDSYSAVYTGEQIRPVMVVSYKYMDGSRQRTLRLKLNVDYILIYENNVNVTDETCTAKVTVKGIGEYAGVITKEFSITPKSIKSVTLSAVGDILFGDNPGVTVTDGTYELVKDIDYKLVDGNGNEVDWPKQGSETADTQAVLKVKGIGNYKDVSNRQVKFNILKSSAANSPDIKSMAADSVEIKFRKLPAKGYTYNGRAVKPAVVVEDGGVKVPASYYKVIYTNNVNAGTQTATVKVVGVTKKGKGCYGVSKELKFDIKQKDFVKVSVSSIAAVPKTSDFGGVTMTVKDGKRILTEGKDYTVDYSSILNADGKLKDDIVIGKKYEVFLKPVSGKNYADNTMKKVFVKFGQLNLASKTANISVKIKDVSKNEVEVMYNGVLLKQGTDYTALMRPDRRTQTYTVTIKAVRLSAYKGTKVVKNLTGTTTSE